jgi:hypothetical protein
VSSFDPSTPSPSKTRRRLAAWAAFGVVGLATGAVWASGFAQNTGVNDATAISPALAKGAPTVAASPLENTITAGADLPFDWEGRWGMLNVDHLMSTVDLTGGAFTGKTYNVALLLANTSDLTEFASLQLELEIIDAANAGTPGDCATADFDGSNDELILDSDDEDSGVYWNALAGNKKYCIGIASTTGDDFDGSFIRSAQDAFPTKWPKFITTVERAS